MKKTGVLLLISVVSLAQVNVQKDIQREFIKVKNGGIVNLPEGSFDITSTLSLEGKENVVVQGNGKTILSFKNQTEGAEGIRVSNCKNIQLLGFTVQDSKGDAVKTMNVDGILFKDIVAEWTGTPDEKNGAYGLYPVQCQNIVIDHCTAIGASDAGIYVGQSKNIVVKNSLAKHNVAGIEIENSLYAEVFDNVATENTGGVLVFDLPDLVQKKGGFVKVYRNKIYNNNYRNFAPKGNIVGTVPAGSGVVILATNNVEVFDNQIDKNNSCGMAIISYYMTERPINDASYYPYPSDIYIHDNTLQRDAVRFVGKGRLGQLFKYKLRFGKKVPLILYDGIEDPNNQPKICVRQPNTSFMNLNADQNFKGMSGDVTKYNCELKIDASSR